MQPQRPESLSDAPKVAGPLTTLLLVGGMVMLVLGGLLLFAAWRTRLAAKAEKGLLIAVRKGETEKGTFTASAKFPFSIDFSLMPLPPSDGGRIDPKLLDQLKKLDVEWTIRDGSGVVASGNATNAPHFNPHAAYHRNTQLGFVKLRRAGTYEFVVKGNSELPGLEYASPQVALKPFVGDASVRGALSTTIGVALGAVGLLLLAVGVWRKDSEPRT